MEKQKVTVEFQNKFCDRLYNTVQKSEFAWLKENCDDESKWVDLIEAVDMAMYNVIKEFFDNSAVNPKFKVGDTVYYIRTKGFGHTTKEAGELIMAQGVICRVYKGKTKTTYYVRGRKMGFEENRLYSDKAESEQILKEIQGNYKQPL